MRRPWARLRCRRRNGANDEGMGWEWRLCGIAEPVVDTFVVGMNGAVWLRMGELRGRRRSERLKSYQWLRLLCPLESKALLESP